MLVVLLFVPVLLYELHCVISLHNKKSSGVHVGGNISAVVWFISYVLLLGLAVIRIWVEGITILGWIGYILFVLAITFRGFALHQLGEFYSFAINLQKNHYVIDTGLYRYLRHPLHLGLFFEMVGLFLLAQNRYAALLVAISFITLITRNLNEEKLLEQNLGETYRRYINSKAWDIIDVLRLKNEN